MSAYFHSHRGLSRGKTKIRRFADDKLLNPSLGLQITFFFLTVYAFVYISCTALYFLSPLTCFCNPICTMLVCIMLTNQLVAFSDPRVRFVALEREKLREVEKSHLFTVSEG